MKRLLILGASILQLPAILKAKELGYFVGVADQDPQAIGVSYADKFFKVSTIDEIGVLNCAKEFRPDGIMTLATDMPMRAIARATTELGLSGISLDAAIKSTDKGEMMKAFKQHDVEAPWFFIINNPEELTQTIKEPAFPCIVKPTDNAGSRGVIMVKEKDKLQEAYQYSRSHSRNGLVIIEEFMTGSEVSVEAMVVNNEAHILAITDKITTGAPHFVEMGHSQPSQLLIEDQAKIKNLTIRALKAIGIENGPAHVEIMVTPGGPKMIELGARMGGDNITTHLVPLSTGIDMVKATIQLSVGETPDIKQEFNKGSAIRYLNSPPGVIVKISGVETAKKVSGVKEIIFTKKEGDKVSSVYKSSTDRLGYCITQGENAAKAVKNCECALSKISIVIK